MPTTAPADLEKGSGLGQPNVRFDFSRFVDDENPAHAGMVMRAR